MRIMVTLLLVLTAAVAALAAELPRWEFNKSGDLEGWTTNEQVRNLRVSDGCLRGNAGDDDPILVSPQCAFATAIGQRIEIRMSSDRGGQAQIFWAPDTKGPYSGFRPNLEQLFEVKGDGKFHTYTLYPFWQGDPEIVRLRLDPPDNARIAIDDIRVTAAALTATAATTWSFASGLHGWQGLRDVEVSHESGTLVGRVTGPAPFILSPQLTADTSKVRWLTVAMSTSSGRVGEAQALSAGPPGATRRSFPLMSDRRMHTYNVFLASSPTDTSKPIAVGVSPSLEPGARFEISSIALGAKPGGKPELELIDFGSQRAITRSGAPASVVCIVINRGGEPARSLKASLTIPDGVVIAGSATAAADQDVPFGRRHVFRWSLLSTQPRAAGLTVTIEAANLPAQAYRTTVDFTAPNPAQPAMIDGKPYVPEPHPVKGKFEVGVYYFPGWKSAGSWDPINRARFPIPYLGFYREGDPEVADWHIKWASEHGINFFIYDWYWCQGGTSLMHALHDGYLKSRYRDRLKFCLLWANHNPPNTSSEQDLLAVTRFWLDNYFKLPEYQTVDGKPLVVIFAPGRFREDMGSEAVRAAFEKMRAMCRAEGLPGLYLAACAMPGEATKLAREGYDAATGYNYPAAGAEGKRWAPYDTMITGCEEIWKEFFKRNEIKYIIPTSPGWDNRPWAGEDALVRFGNTPDKFADMCRRAKTLLLKRPDTPENRVVVVEAWNEFGEGSYCEPTKPYGFGYLDAIRRVFTDAPEKHVDVVPEDVGLGPYDVNIPVEKRAWEFEKPGDDEGWGSVMGMTDVRVEDGRLKATATSSDFAFFGPGVSIDAAVYRRVVIRMMTDKPGSGQLFWSTDFARESEATSYTFPLIGDGQFHEYALKVGDVPTWAGEIRRLRLDPGYTIGAHVEVDYIRVVE